MRDVSGKGSSLRTARARAILRVDPTTVERVKSGDLPKANPLGIAEIAGVQGAKSTPSLIPYCHSVPLDQVVVEAKLAADSIVVEASVRAVYKTGVEMEALTAVSVAALTLYDMLKIVDDSMKIESIELLDKTGGKSDAAMALPRGFPAGVVVVSDGVSNGTREDRTGPLIRERLESEGAALVSVATVPDDAVQIAGAVKKLTDDGARIVITTGGTGVGPRDVTPEAMSHVFEREMPGIAEHLRAYGQQRVPYAMLSRGRAGMRGCALVVNLPGSVGGVREGLDALFPYIRHALHVATGGGHE